MAKPWADQPYGLVPVPGTPGAPTTSNNAVLYMAADMANIHNVLLRGLNAIYLQCEHINPAKDTKDFALYVKAWGDLVQHHHHGEEASLFPKLEELAKAQGATEAIMDTNIAQHDAFTPGLSEMLEYVRSIQDGTAVYDGKRLKAMIEAFAPALTQHLHDELDTLLKLEKFDGEPFKQAYDATVADGAKTADTSLVIPIVFGCNDKTHPGAEKFPPVPFFLQWLNYLFFMRKHSGCWRFNPCDAWSRPRPFATLRDRDDET